MAQSSNLTVEHVKIIDASCIKYPHYNLLLPPHLPTWATLYIAIAAFNRSLVLDNPNKTSIVPPRLGGTEIADLAPLAPLLASRGLGHAGAATVAGEHDALYTGEDILYSPSVDHYVQTLEYHFRASGDQVPLVAGGVHTAEEFPHEEEPIFQKRFRRLAPPFRQSGSRHARYGEFFFPVFDHLSRETPPHGNCQMGWLALRLCVAILNKDRSLVEHVLQGMRDGIPWSELLFSPWPVMHLLYKAVVVTASWHGARQDRLLEKASARVMSSEIPGEIPSITEADGARTAGIAAGRPYRESIIPPKESSEMSSKARRPDTLTITMSPTRRTIEEPTRSSSVVSDLVEDNPRGAHDLLPQNLRRVNGTAHRLFRRLVAKHPDIRNETTRRSMPSLVSLGIRNCFDDDPQVRDWLRRDIRRGAYQKFDVPFYTGLLSDFVLSFTSRFAGTSQQHSFPYHDSSAFYRILARDFCGEFLFLYAFMQLGMFAGYSQITPGFVVRWLQRWFTYPKLTELDHYASNTDNVIDLDVELNPAAPTVADPPSKLSLLQPWSTSTPSTSGADPENRADRSPDVLSLLNALRRGFGGVSVVYLFSAEFHFWMAQLVQKEFEKKVEGFDVEGLFLEKFREEQRELAGGGAASISVASSPSSVLPSTTAQSENQHPAGTTPVSAIQSDTTMSPSTSPATSPTTTPASPTAQNPQRPSSKPSAVQHTLEAQITRHEKSALLELLHGVHQLCEAFDFPYMVGQRTLLLGA